MRERGLTVVPEAPRRTLERSYDYAGLSNGVEAGEEVQDDIPYHIQVNYTDTKLSHRFVRFELPDEIEVDDMRRTVQSYLDSKRQDPNSGIVVAKLQVDSNLLAEDGE